MTTGYLWLSLILFGIGVAGVLMRRNALVILMGIELMLNAVNLLFVAFGSYYGQIEAQVFVFFVMVIAAAEAAVGLAIFVTLYRNLGSIDASDARSLKW